MPCFSNSGLHVLFRVIVLVVESVESTGLSLFLLLSVGSSNRKIVVYSELSYFLIKYQI